jgi:hypothetical protein
MNLSGSAHEISARITGSGNINALKVIADIVTITVSGSGDMKTYCRETLNAAISGSGDVYYTGNPAEVKSKVSGSGTIREIE